jgi:hypothetical protein
VLVALLGRELVLKMYPPFLRDHFEFERAMLGHLQGRLSLPTPRCNFATRSNLAEGVRHGGFDARIDAAAG